MAQPRALVSPDRGTTLAAAPRLGRWALSLQQLAGLLHLQLLPKHPQLRFNSHVQNLTWNMLDLSSSATLADWLQRKVGRDAPAALRLPPGVT